MRQKLFLLVALCFVCFFSGRAQTVIESESNLSFNETSAGVSLTVENPKPAFDAGIEVELLDAESKILAQSAESARIENGKKSYNLTLPLGDLMQKSVDDIFWYRLRYRVGAGQGIVSLSQIMRDIFELRVMASDNLLSGMNYRSRVRALNPLTNTPVEGVAINAALELETRGEDEQKLKLTAAGTTDREGFATLDFQIPVDADFNGDGEIKVTGRKNGVLRLAEEDLETAADDFYFLMFADKPIYQPEQFLNVRGILMKGAESKTVVPDAEVEFRIEDNDDTVLYREKVKTSAFGVAAIRWTIPENAKLGDYRIRVKNKSQEEGSFVGYQKIKISRYDLPNFKVDAKPSKPYYLPNEKQAEIEVSADYLFGKPVREGKVRVVRENSREWNWKEQRYVIDEGEAHDGKTDENGKFTAKFDVSEDHEDLAEDESDRFDDITFTAYFTDLTTNRTEQRQFDVRVTREPVHVYFIGERYDQNPNLPVSAYVSTFYADGTPAACDVELRGREEDSDQKFKTLQRIKTNSYGAGRLEFTRPKFEDETDDLEIQLIARDRNGLKGTFGVGEDNEESVDFDDDEVALQINTGKTIFKPDEAVEIELTSTKQTALVYVDVVRGWSVIDSRFVNLTDGKARLKIPYQPDFKGELKISAYFEELKTGQTWDNKTRSYYNSEYLDLVTATRGIIFPYGSNLKLNAEFDKEFYKPGEAARVRFGVLDSIGSAVESALGVVVFDKAIEERARTDGGFTGMFEDYKGWLGYGESFGGVNVKDLNELDLSKPIPAELQTVAEVILHDGYYRPNVFHSRSFDTNAKSVYAEFFKKQFEPIEKVLSGHYAKHDFEHPTDDESLRKILRANGVNLDDLRDPWGQPFKAVFETEKVQDVLRIVSAGADKTFGTKDDFTVSSSSFIYFTPTGNLIDKAVTDYHKRTGGFIRDEKTLFAGLGISELKDRFGNPYRVTLEVNGKYYVMKIRSAGKDGKYDTGYSSDDFDVWTNRIDYFADTQSAIVKILETANIFPQDESQFKAVLRDGGVDFDRLTDGYGKKLYLVRKRTSRYTDKRVLEKVQKYGETTAIERLVIVPVTEDVITFTVRGKGADRRENTSDDVTFAEFQHVISEQTRTDEKPKPVSIQPAALLLRDGTGSISGTVRDASGAAITGATVTATNEKTNVTRSVTSNEDGIYTIVSLAVGRYSVNAEAANFKKAVRESVPVTANSNTKVDFSLDVGTVSAVVDVESSATTIDTSSSSISSSTNAQQIALLPKRVDSSNFLKMIPGARTDSLTGGFTADDGTNNEKSTPRLREYFPETLVWSPELVTGTDGKAALDFKMADNITTWKLYTVASTRAGKIGVAEKEITVFQPFFVDLEPPKFLTDGDEIYLPAQVRNYTAAKQTVDVSMTKADWFSFLGADKQTVEVASNAAANAVFGFKAVIPVKDGKQKVTAIAISDADAIEKPVTVRPNGQEVVRTESKLFAGAAAFDVDFPADALPKSARAELKIYPNPMSHVTESVEGLLKRPYGCGEQTISSTYPNLMILKFKSASPGAGKTLVEKRAKKFLDAGYKRLLGYQTADGGFSYWGGKDSSDLALTAYALRFLSDARGFIEVDPKVVENARNYLIKQQRGDGSFTKKYSWETVEDTARAKLFTSYVARTLAMLKTEKGVLDKALVYLKTRNAEIEEPYALALYTLANFDAGERDEADKTLLRLQSMAKDENGFLYWSLETNTPFYGWGTAGRIETTALVLQALLKSKDQSPQTRDQISKATMFLLKSKDRYGVWYSTQTTINVLDAFLASLTPGKNQTISVSVNGEKLKDFAVQAEQIEPVVLDLTGNLSAANRVEVASSDNSQVMAQIVRAHYVDWKDAEISNRSVNDSRAVRLDYKCDKQQAKIMETVNCAVEAERVGFKGYGMLLAEIGIPPGADVSRDSLDKAFDADWSLSRYDVLPDRIVVYMWARAGGSKFNFSFKPRYAVNAQTPASLLYDYYNDEARATLAPQRFEVK
ncbi:MAG TPA: alpha-2-macroglobulin family protein [Pyrinomonadaceae bacterium]|jgi:hypothetical protein